MWTRSSFPAICASILLASVLFCSQSGAAFNITDCSKDSLGNIGGVTITDCPSSEPVCKLVQGSTPSIQMKFTAASPFKQARVQIFSVIGGFRKLFVVKPDEACTNYGVTCPAKAHDTETFSLSLPINSYYPRISFVIEVGLLDENKKQIVCAQFPAKIVGKK